MVVGRMPQFVPYSQSSLLPDEGGDYERATLDLKRSVDPKGGFHIAKDVAAFANHLGGTLLIGVTENRGRVAKYMPLGPADIAETRQAVSNAVRDRLSPKPLVDMAVVPRGDGGIVAVNVWPFIGQPVGVRVTADKEADGHGGDAYVFPLRTMVDSVYLLPEQLPMFMLPALRRTVILLNSIPPGAIVHVIALSTSGSREEGHCRITRIDELKNVVKFEPLPKQTPGAPHGGWITADKTYPLDLIASVSESIGKWDVYVRAWYG